MNDRQIITRREAADSGLVRFYTGRPCVHGHDSERYTSTGGCIACLRMFFPKKNGDKAVAAGIKHWPPEAFMFLVDDGKLVSREEAEMAFRLMADQRWHLQALKLCREQPELRERYYRAPLTQRSYVETLNAAKSLPLEELENILQRKKSESLL